MGYSGEKDFWWVEGGHGRAYFSGVGWYSLIKTYAVSDNSFCNLRYQINTLLI